jgi:hypothetical protein
MNSSIATSLAAVIAGLAATSAMAQVIQQRAGGDWTYECPEVSVPQNIAIANVTIITRSSPTGGMPGIKPAAPGAAGLPAPWESKIPAAAATTAARGHLTAVSLSTAGDKLVCSYSVAGYASPLVLNATLKNSSRCKPESMRNGWRGGKLAGGEVCSLPGRSAATGSAAVSAAVSAAGSADAGLCTLTCPDK